MTFPILLVAVFAADAKPAAVDKEELKKLQGKWAVTRREHGGEVDAAAAIKDIRVTVAAGKMTVHADEKVTQEVEITRLGGKARPSEVDLKVIAGADKGEVIKGIYKVEKGAITFCLAEPGKERPKKFEGAKGTGHTVLVLGKAKE